MIFWVQIHKAYIKGVLDLCVYVCIHILHDILKFSVFYPHLDNLTGLGLINV